MIDLINNGGDGGFQKDGLVLHNRAGDPSDEGFRTRSDHRTGLETPRFPSLLAPNSNANYYERAKTLLQSLFSNAEAFPEKPNIPNFVRFDSVDFETGHEIRPSGSGGLIFSPDTSGTIYKIYSNGTRTVHKSY